MSDPLSIAALFHLSLIAQEPSDDAVSAATLRVLRTLLDDRDAAETWGREDLVRFGSAYRRSQVALQAPYPAPTLLAVAERVYAAYSELEVAPAADRTVSTIDRRLLTVEPRSFGTVWLLACHLPQALVSASLTSQFVPTFVGLPRYLTASPKELAADLERTLGQAAFEGLAELDRLEARLSTFADEWKVTSRSRLPELMRLDLAYPGLRIPAIARLLGISPQGASKLASQAKTLKAGMQVRIAGDVALPWR
ncbi:hypothetical protein [Sphingomonas sp. 10B4]|uniref:hypothetical protein n=1 Tax=Sphingomonas sp. 10B4 TaxID=3048575 RepID=UPI002AB37C1D|nr:hypothetical protein [Sphingomonas sp. 10B4]MDY7524255.1 hypothetical protein [Sphingomonas sp. 10B4]MEB0283793.1 hypothetical protein [Sphingomonas sp. 10B4]